MSIWILYEPKNLWKSFTDLILPSDNDMAQGSEAYQTENITYDHKVNPGQIYKIDIAKEEIAGKGIEKVKYKYPVGTWSDYHS